MKSFKKYFSFDAQPIDIYNAMTDQEQIEIWTGEKADFKAEPGTEFSMWDESICGRNLEFVEGKKIVQLWYFEEVDSQVTIKFHKSKSGGTSMEVNQIDIPDEAYDNIVDGWTEDYFDCLADLYNQ